MFYLHHTPGWMRQLFPPELIWDFSAAADKEVYVTFDDGPHPEITPWVMQQLAAASMHGTFFCIGNNVSKYPDVYRQLLSEGHAVGNHTMQHENARNTTALNYAASVQQAGEWIQSNLFRPPYGRLPHSHARLLRKNHPSLQIVMWSVLTGDFDHAKDGQDCFEIVKRRIEPGSIIVFHDSEKAWPRLQQALPLTIQWLQQNGWKSKALPMVIPPA